MAPREKPRNKNSKPPIEEYALVIDGAPLSCRWQELKDFIREYAPHIRQAEIYEDENGKPTGRGSVIVRGLEEAQRAYHALSRRGWDGHSITVVLAKRVNGGALVTLKGPTVSSNQTARMPNPATYGNNPRHVSAASPPISPSYPGYSPAVDTHAEYYNTTGTYQPMLAASHMTSASTVMALPYVTAAVSPEYGQYRNAHYVDVNIAPSYQQNVTYNAVAPAYTNGHHVTAPNMSRHTASRPPSSRAQDATIVSPNRTIFLTKLPYNAVGQAVRRLLEPFGKVERCDVPLDKTSPNKIQGTAIAKFKEPNDAARAIRDLNGTRWRGVTISARWDRDSARTSNTISSIERPVQASQPSSGTNKATNTTKEDDAGARDQRRRAVEGPLIVNGSRGTIAPSRSRRGSRENDSDSSDYDDDDDDNDSNSSDEEARPAARCASGRHH